MKDRSTPDLRMSYLEHRAMRVDAARLAALVTAARPDDTARLHALARWYTGYEGAIHDHHRTEEVVIYPALLERDPSFADADAELEGQHSVLIDRLTGARESLGGLAAGAGGSRWVLDHGTAAERAELLAEQPLLMRVLYRLALRPRYERLARPLRRDHMSVR